MSLQAEHEAGKKSALVSLVIPSGLRTRVVTFFGNRDGLLTAVLERFKNLLFRQTVYLQIEDTSRGSFMGFLETPSELARAPMIRLGDKNYRVIHFMALSIG